MRLRPYACVALLGVVLALPRSARAQEDFRSADAGRPIRVEDATPIKFREWEVELGSRGGFEEGARGLEGILELKAGLIRNAQIGIEVEGAWESGPDGADAATGLEAFSAHLLYALRRETPAMPALAVRLDASSPGAGDVRNRDAQFGLEGIGTRSFGRFRIHGNGGYTFASVADGGDFWRLGVGGDYPLGLFSTAVLADVYLEVPADAGSTRSWIDVGTRLQLTNRTVLDLGLSTRVDQWNDGHANVEVVLGFSRVFGIPRGGPAYPDPAIR
jgi:hypothetical protein